LPPRPRPSLFVLPLAAEFLPFSVLPLYPPKWHCCCTPLPLTNQWSISNQGASSPFVRRAATFFIFPPFLHKQAFFPAAFFFLPSCSPPFPPSLWHHLSFLHTRFFPPLLPSSSFFSLSVPVSLVETLALFGVILSPYKFCFLAKTSLFTTTNLGNSPFPPLTLHLRFFVPRTTPGRFVSPLIGAIFFSSFPSPRIRCPLPFFCFLRLYHGRTVLPFFLYCRLTGHFPL